MKNIEFNLFYDNNGIQLEEIINTLIEEKIEIITQTIKTGGVIRYNTTKDYLSTNSKKEVDNK